MSKFYCQIAIAVLICATFVGCTEEKITEVGPDAIPMMGANDSNDKFQQLPAPPPLVAPEGH